MIYKDGNVAENTKIIKTAIDKSEAIIIGVGSGLSTAAELDYDNADTFNVLVLSKSW